MKIRDLITATNAKVLRIFDEEFAKKNQVIFITCDSKYKKMLGGNIINF